MQITIDGFNYEYKGKVIGIITEDKTKFNFILNPKSLSGVSLKKYMAKGGSR
jgi:hypothetical protein